jgi:hypothetical protein
MWLQFKSKKENPNKMWLQSHIQMGESRSMWTNPNKMWLQSHIEMGESRSMWTPHHQCQSKLTTDEWVSV